MWAYQGATLGAGLAEMGSAIYGAEQRKNEEVKQRAREFKSLQEYADAAGIAPKVQTTPMDLESLQGLVKGYHAKQKLEEQGLTMDQLRQVIEASKQTTEQRGQMFPWQLQQAQQGVEQSAALHPLQLQSMQQTVAGQQANLDAAAAGRAAIPAFLRTLDEGMNPPPTVPMAPQTVPMGQALPAALARHPELLQSPHGIQLLNALDRMAPTTGRPVVAPQIIDLGGTKVLWNPTTGAASTIKGDRPGTIRVVTGNPALGETQVTRNMSPEEYAAWKGEQSAGAAAQATMEPAVLDAYQKYRAAQDQITSGNRYVGPEASWLPSFGDRTKVTKTTGAQLEKLTGRPPTAWTPQQHQVMTAQPYIPPPAPGKIVVVAPNGATAYLPTAQWPQAQREGYLQLPFTTAPGSAK